MKLYKLNINGFRKHYNTEIIFSDSTFLIGENNVGKSSVLYAIDYLLNGTSIPEEEFYSVDEKGNRKRKVNEVIITAEFRDIPKEANSWRGFKGRLLHYYDNNSEESGLKFIYRKTFPVNGKAKIQTLEPKKSLKQEYKNCKSIKDFISAGLLEKCLPEELKENDFEKKLTNKDQKILEEYCCEELMNIDYENENWIENPGGIPQNVLSKLPRFLLIPAEDKAEEISGKNGTLQNTLNELFREVRERSDNYKKAQEYLDKLAQELNPSDEKTEVSKMIKEINQIISEVFPQTGINAMANLSDADSVIKPNFDIQMNSNIKTSSNLQGTGLVRSTVFALLRYKALKDNEGVRNDRDLIIGFEEPEIYLHPNAINKMRDTIYNLAETASNQIICTTHSPYMIDISKKPNQILNSLSVKKEDDNISINAVAFNISKEFKLLQEDEKTYIKMLLKIDENVSKCFFVKKVLIVEGDTEQVVLMETINRMRRDDKEKILSNWHILRARGKAVIISLIKYLKAMQIDIYVMHDKDENNQRARRYNDPIRMALNNDSHLFVLENCIEDVLGYTAPKSEKPYKAYEYINKNWTSWENVSKEWKEIINKIFSVNVKD